MKLLSTFNLGNITLSNRVVMAPMTRSRALQNIPSDLIASYYRQRASAGLIITEGTSPSPNGLGYPRIPGLFTPEQSRGWQLVTQAVHDKGGKIFLQLMHTGRVSHPANMPVGAKILAPSAIQLSGQMYTDSQGLQNYPLPKEMSESEIQETIQEFVTSADMAIQSGFDGIELHGANGYLLEQFLNPATNKRQDKYGQTSEGRMRFVLELATAVVKKIGGDRVGIRVSPYGVFNDMGPFPGIDSFYTDLSSKLSALGLVYIHVVDHSGLGAPLVSPEIKQLIRANFRGSYILSGNYDTARAEKELSEGKGDLVAFGRPFIANPDLVEKFKNNLPLRDADQSTFYTPGPQGYIDY